ncbi:MAG: alpha-L-fucosidase [Verrucomicrobiales bacterium]|nr:alpha-L-fucosidase [Verrucomicrobiales bacterium]
MNRLTLVPVCALTSLSVPNLTSAPAADVPLRDYTREWPADRARRMAWFEEARFGMFIHWGLYAVPAGEWKGKKVSGIGEWIMEHGKIPVSEYETLVPQFNPVKFDAREWVRIAKNAGMKYIVITSKHHDGFGLWPSELTDWCIKSTPFGRDPLKELADACREAGIRLCFYYSIMDWHHPDWPKRRPWHDKATGQPDMDRYVAYMKGQLKELITRYGPLGILWFDGEWEEPWTHERGVDLYNYVRSLQPDIIVNNRVGKGRKGMDGMDKEGRGVGDYGTPEQRIPPTGFGPGVYWESCMTMNDTWGYRKDDHNWKSVETLVRNLIDCASKGGNYLLNVGPTAEGLIPQPSVERLAAIGRWMQANSEAIYGTRASPFEKLDWGRCTQKPHGIGTTRLYLHVFDWPADGRLVVPPLANKPLRAALLATGQKLRVKKTGNQIVITVPKEAPDKIATVIALDIQGEPLVPKPGAALPESSTQRDARMKHWRDARFGMFVHWGPVSLKGTEIGWSRGREIPVEEYDRLYLRFNPTNFNARDWARLARDAGMKYLVFTTKHHDGFCMWNTQQTDFNIMRSPFGRDVVGELAAACRAEGVAFGTYHSVCDWHHPDFPLTSPGGKVRRPLSNLDRYEQYLHAQVTELIRNYGPLWVMWFDVPQEFDTARGQRLIDLCRSLQPGIIVNNRSGAPGDYDTPEQRIGGYQDTRPWETCMTLGTQWAWKPNDRIKSLEECIHNLIRCAGGDGNFLFNVGPRPDGLIEPDQAQRLREMGAWLRQYGRAIYGTRGGPFKPTDSLASTRRGNTIYLHVLDWKTDTLRLPPLQARIRATRVLTGGTADVQQSTHGISIRVAPEHRHDIATLIALKLDRSAMDEPAVSVN